MGILPPVVCQSFLGCSSWKHKNDPKTQSKYWVQSFHCNKENMIQLWDNGWRRGGLMVGMLVSGSSCPGLSPGRGQCVVFLGKTPHSVVLGRPFQVHC